MPTTLYHALMNVDFTEIWSRVRDEVRVYCMRLAGGRQPLADDAFQATAQRLRNGFASFQRTSDFLVFAQRQARAEVCRLAHELLNAPKAETTGVEESPTWIDAIVAAARAEGQLFDKEEMLLRSRVAHPKAGWETHGRAIGLPAARTAARHARIVSRLAVFLFTRRPELLGDTARLEHAFREAELTATEANVFRAVVLDRPRTDYRPAGWSEELASACGKVIRRIEFPEPRVFS